MECLGLPVMPANPAIDQLSRTDRESAGDQSSKRRGGHLTNRHRLHGRVQDEQLGICNGSANRDLLVSRLRPIQDAAGHKHCSLRIANTFLVAQVPGKTVTRIIKMKRKWPSPFVVSAVLNKCFYHGDKPVDILLSVASIYGTQIEHQPNNSSHGAWY